jgi:KDO2-lipid IV(A) lauroyltransferase
MLSNIMKDTRKLVENNLSIIGGGRYTSEEMEKLTRSTFQNYGRYLLDYMVMHRIEEHNAHKCVEEKGIGEENLIAAMKIGKGILCITPHLGNWELGGIMLALRGYKINVLSLKDNREKISTFRERIRMKYGIKSIYVDGEGINTIINILNALKKKEIVALLGDRDGTSRTIEVDFFGRKTKFPVGVAYFALASGAPVVPVFEVLRKNGKYQGIIERPILFNEYNAANRDEAIKMGIQEIARIFERYIREYPDQWYNFYPFWSSQ